MKKQTNKFFSFILILFLYFLSINISNGMDSEEVLKLKGINELQILLGNEITAKEKIEFEIRNIEDDISKISNEKLRYSSNQNNIDKEIKNKSDNIKKLEKERVNYQKKKNEMKIDSDIREKYKESIEKIKKENNKKIDLDKKEKLESENLSKFKKGVSGFKKVFGWFSSKSKLKKEKEDRDRRIMNSLNNLRSITFSKNKIRDNLSKLEKEKNDNYLKLTIFDKSLDVEKNLTDEKVGLNKLLKEKNNFKRKIYDFDLDFKNKKELLKKSKEKLNKFNNDISKLRNLISLKDKEEKKKEKNIINNISNLNSVIIDKGIVKDINKDIHVDNNLLKKGESLKKKSKEVFEKIQHTNIDSIGKETIEKINKDTYVSNLFVTLKEKFYKNVPDIWGISGVKNRLFGFLKVDKFSTDYKEKNLRIIIKGKDDKNTFIQSEQYGDFYIDGDLKLFKSDTINPACKGEGDSYYFSGSLRSYNWGVTLPYIKDEFNYYCPVSRKSSSHFNSAEFGDIKIIDSIGDNSLKILVDSRGDTQTVKTAVLNQDVGVQVNGLVASDNKLSNSNLNIEGESKNISTLSQKTLNGNINNKYTTVVNRNIALLTRGFKFINDVYHVNSLDSEFNLYDYSDQEELVGINGNKGKILQLGNGGSRSDYSKITVRGEKNLIIKGGNLYIKGDILNKDKNSILTIVVKRDKNNKKNGGNVYIDPNVTNIDAVIIADGSILSYNGGNKVLAIDENKNLLSNQLLIYGLLGTKNAIGDNSSVYGTDDFLVDNRKKDMGEYSIYNLENLRSFRVAELDGIAVESTSDCNDIGRIVGVDTSSVLKTYSFAGKKKCYWTGEAKEGYRTTEKVSPLVIEYNPNIQLKTPKLLRN